MRSLDLSGFPTDVNTSNSLNIEVLGAPIGEDSFRKELTRRNADSASELLRKLPRLEDPRWQWPFYGSVEVLRAR
jgi:hypothetical protein